MSAAPVMILAGGTGGHVYPALVVAHVLRRRDVPVVWVGTRLGLEAEVVPAAGIAMEWLAVRGLRGRRALSWLSAPLMLGRALFKALTIMRRHRPRAVLGMGGYAAGPGAVAAWLMRRPLLIHEQNAVAGMTNRCLARLAQRVMTGFERVFPPSAKAVVVGNPVRGEIVALGPPRQRYATHSGPPRLLVFGGSLGARALNEQVAAALARLPQEQRPLVRHQAGQRTLQVAEQAYQRYAVAAEVIEYIDDMAAAYDWADLVVCRAGAVTVAELAAAGVPAVFVPFPHAVDDHQTENARFLTEADAGVLLPESELSVETLARTLTALLSDRERLVAMAERARERGRPNAAEAVAEACLEVAR